MDSSTCRYVFNYVIWLCDIKVHTIKKNIVELSARVLSIMLRYLFCIEEWENEDTNRLV